MLFCVTALTLLTLVILILAWTILVVVKWDETERGRDLTDDQISAMK